MISFESEPEHEKFEKLCAFATAGILTPEELESLTLHLGTCASCTQSFAEYRRITTEGIPSLAEHFASNPDADAFEQSSALERLMCSTATDEPQRIGSAVVASRRRVWHYGWVQRSAAAILLLAVGAEAYRVGAHSATAPIENASTNLQPALDRAIEQKQGLERTLQAENQKILALEQQETAEQNALARFRAQANDGAERATQLAAQLIAAKIDANQQLTAMAQERDANISRLRDAERMYQNAQDDLGALRNQHQQDVLRAASLETRVNSLNAALNDQNKRRATDGQFLALDKDVRDLIGARNLYIADIIDVNETGQSKKPFGRIFYTKTKSLIFYAYDLNQQPGVKQASTFQVWGRTSANDRKPVNLGILYMDSETNQRWTLRVDNPERLANLDAVFVTVEPHEQTDKPTGKPFLYASLRREANHP